MSTQQLQTRTQTAVQLRGIVESDAYKKRFAELLRDRAPQFVASMVQLVNATPQLQACDPHSIIAAAVTAAALDLPIEKSLGFAWIVPYGNQAQFQLGYRGYIQLAIRTGQYRYINVTEIFEGELDFHNKLTSEIVIKPENKKSDKIVGYAAYFKLVSGYEHAEYWDAETVDVHAKRYSQAYRSGRDTPWKTDFEAMACKTVIKSLLSHWGPMSVQMQRAVIEDAAVHADVDAPPTYPDNDGSADPKKPDLGVPLSIMPPQEQSASLPPTAASGPVPPPARRGRPPGKKPETAPPTAAPAPEPPPQSAEPEDDLPFDAPEATQEPQGEPQGGENPFEPASEPQDQPEAQPEPVQESAPVSEPPELGQLRAKLAELNITEAKVIKFCTEEKIAVTEKVLSDFITTKREWKIKQLLKALNNPTLVARIQQA